MPSPVLAAIPTASWRAVGVGLVVGGAGLATAVGTSVLSFWSAALAVLVYGCGAALIGRSWRAERFGVANAVTLARLVGTCGIVALTAEAAVSAVGGDPASVGDRLALVVLATTCLVLDGVDGRIARARQEVSRFGARFDVETDTLQLVAMSIAVPLVGVAGWWTLLLPGLRYGYLLGARFVPALRIPLSYGIRSRKVAAVVGQASLIAAVAVDLIRPGWPSSGCVAVGLVTLVWSFGRDVGWQLRRRRAYAAADVLGSEGSS